MHRILQLFYIMNKAIPLPLSIHFDLARKVSLFMTLFVMMFPNTSFMHPSRFEYCRRPIGLSILIFVLSL
jgi:hypothetical protein